MKRIKESSYFQTWLNVSQAGMQTDMHAHVHVQALTCTIDTPAHTKKKKSKDPALDAIM
jgi:hypothetical protein